MSNIFKDIPDKLLVNEFVKRMADQNTKTQSLLDEAVDIIKDHHDKLWSVELDDRVAMFLDKLEQK